MNADGSGISRLTNDSAIDYSPDWSPDGKRVVYRSHNGGPADIYVINIDGTGLTNLTITRQKTGRRPGLQMAARSPSRPTEMATGRSTQCPPMERIR